MRILITGFAGTLGGEFTRQLLAKGNEVHGVDNNEWAVACFPDHPKLVKHLQDFSAIKGHFDLIIHAAAYKHVELIEDNPISSFENNVQKTEALYNNVSGPVLFISTDKAVEPASFYGMVKKIGEMLTHKRGGMIARLGNIYASSGSVIPKWEASVQNSDPLPVTDPEMTRYMIPVDLAVARILDLYPFAEDSQIIVPAMGDPIKLGDLVKRFLEDKDLPEDYPIKLIGRRAGEKQHEKLVWDYEKAVHTDKNGSIYS